MASFEIVEVDPCCDDALALLREAAIEARWLYSDLIAPTLAWPTNAPAGPGDTYLVVYSAGMPVACGALRMLSGTTVEVRRMFVRPRCRRQCIARALLAELEFRARQLGYAVTRLETGRRQSPAMALYASCGFERIPPFGQHAQDPTSVCLEKSVVRVGSSGA